MPHAEIFVFPGELPWGEGGSWVDMGELCQGGQRRGRFVALYGAMGLKEG